METVLFSLAGLAFACSPTLAPLALRCGLSACLRFSPRAAVALASVCALFGCGGALLARGGLRAVPPGQRAPVAIAGAVGGTLGRMAMLLFTARFPGSIALARIQSPALLLLVLLALLPARARRLPLPRTPLGLGFLSFWGAVLEGHLGCGAAALLGFASSGGVRRRKDAPASAALLLGLTAQSCALLLTLLSGGAQVFPMRMLAAIALGAALGGWQFERAKERGRILHGLRAALAVYLVFAVLADAEQAYLPP